MNQQVHQKKTLPQFITIKKLSEHLSFSEARIRWEIHKRRIPFVKIGKSIRFDLNEIGNWLKNARIGETHGK